MKKIACLLCLAMLLSLFTACAANDKQPDNTDKTSTTTETAATDGEILKFALVGPLTGAGAQYGLAYRMLIYGVIMVVVVLFMPSGLMGKYNFRQLKESWLLKKHEQTERREKNG